MKYLTQVGRKLINEFKAPSIRGTLAGAAARVGTKPINSSPRVSGRQDPSLRNNDLPSGFPSWTSAQNKEIDAMANRAKDRRAPEIAGRFVGGSPHGTPAVGRRYHNARLSSGPWSTEPNTGSQGQLDTHRERDKEIRSRMTSAAKAMAASPASKEIADSPDPEKDSGYFQKNAFNRPSAANRSELDIERMRSSRQSKVAKLSPVSKIAQELSRPERGDSNQGLLDKMVKNTPSPDAYRGPGDTIPAKSGRSPSFKERQEDRIAKFEKEHEYIPTAADKEELADRKASRPGAGKVHRQHKNIMAKRDAREKQASSDEKNRMAHADKFDPTLLRQQQLDRVSDVMKRTKDAKDSINLNDLPNTNGNTNSRLGRQDKNRPKVVHNPHVGPEHVTSRGIGDQLRNYYRNVIRRR